MPDTKKQIYWSHQVEPLQRKIQDLQRRLLRHVIKDAARLAGTPAGALEFIADRAEKEFENELSDWEDGDVAKISKLSLEFFLSKTRREAPFLWEGSKAPAGREPGVQNKDDFRSEQEEAAFMVKHGVEVYNGLPGKSKFLTQYTKP